MSIAESVASPQSDKKTIFGGALMPGWKDLLLETLKLTDEIKRLNRDIERLDNHVVNADKRVVRLETMVELAQ